MPASDPTIRLLVNAVRRHRGGGLTVLLGMLEAWREAEYPLHVTVLASKEEVLAALDDSGWADHVEPVLQGAGGTRQFVWENTRLGRHVARFEPDVLLNNNLYAHLVRCPQVVHHQDLWHFAAALGPDLLRSVRGDRLRNWAAAQALRRADANVFVSQFIRDQAEKLVPESRDRNFVIHNGLPASVVRAASTGSAYDGRANLIAVQTANRHKDNETLLRTLALLVEEMPDVDWRLDVVGNPGRASWAPIQQMAAELGVAQRITWRGYCSQDELDPLLRRSLCLVFTSVLESFGLPPLEAMARCCPVVAARATAVPEVVGDAGMLVPQSSPQSFAEAIARIYRDHELRDDLVARGLKRIEQFSWRESGEQFYRLFRDLVDQTAGDA